MCALTLQFLFDVDLWQVQVKLVTKTGSIAARCFTSEPQVSAQLPAAAATMKSLFAPDSDKSWAFRVGAFGDGFGGGALHIALTCGSHGKFLARVEVETDPIERSPMDRGVFHFSSDMAEVDAFLAQIESVSKLGTTEAVLTGTSFIPTP